MLAATGEALLREHSRQGFAREVDHARRRCLGRILLLVVDVDSLDQDLALVDVDIRPDQCIHLRGFALAEHAVAADAGRSGHQDDPRPGEADLSRIDAGVFGQSVELTRWQTDFAVVDLWNGIIRPALVTECMLLWSLHLCRHNWMLDEHGWALVGAALGIFVADRSLLKRANNDPGRVRSACRPGGEALARRFEGLYLAPYSCPAGVATVGYGATFYEDGAA